MTEEEGDLLNTMSLRLSALTEALSVMNSRQNKLDEKQESHVKGVHEHLSMIHDYIRGYFEEMRAAAPRRSAMMDPSAKAHDWILKADATVPDPLTMSKLAQASMKVNPPIHMYPPDYLRAKKGRPA